MAIKVCNCRCRLNLLRQSPRTVPEGQRRHCPLRGFPHGGRFPPLPPPPPPSPQLRLTAPSASAEKRFRSPGDNAVEYVCFKGEGEGGMSFVYTTSGVGEKVRALPGWTRTSPQRWAWPPGGSSGAGQAADFVPLPLRAVSKRHKVSSAAAKGCVPVESSTRFPCPASPTDLSPLPGPVPSAPAPAQPRSAARPPAGGPHRLTGSAPTLSAGQLRRGFPRRASECGGSRWAEGALRGEFLRAVRRKGRERGARPRRDWSERWLRALGPLSSTAAGSPPHTSCSLGRRKTWPVRALVLRRGAGREPDTAPDLCEEQEASWAPQSRVWAARRAAGLYSSLTAWAG